MAFAQQVRPIPGAVATAGVDERLTFIKKTYAHLGGAIGLFVLLEYLFFTSGLAEQFGIWALSGMGNMIAVLVLFMAAGWLGDWWARSDTSRGLQYLGLALYIVAEVVVIAPLLFIAMYFVADPYIIHKAAIITLFMFGGLTGTVLLTRKDFSFMGGFLRASMFAAMGMILVSWIFGVGLGTWFSGAMILVAAGYILYETSQVLAHYRPTQYVGASLALFAAVALLFFYVLRLLIQLQGE
jgi:FtsH-binding integral membrane protein